MTPARITVVIQPRGKSISQSAGLVVNSDIGDPIKSLPHHVRIGRRASTEELYDALAQASGLSIYRLKITKESDCTLVPNSNETTIEEAGVKDMDVVTVKDLGILKPR